MTAAILKEQAANRLRGALDAHERAVARAEEESGLYQRVEDMGAAFGVQPPQLARLRFGQLEAGHLEEFSFQPADESLCRFFAFHGRRVWR
jgi:hypothetical protein